MGPHPAVAQVRYAVRHALADLEPGALVLVACSGGADSTALATATAFEARRMDWVAGAVTVDHGLQEGSAGRAVEVAAMLARLGLDPVQVSAVAVGGAGGPEGAARDARYAALEEVAVRRNAAAVLLAHSRDDQAETVLLGLARGSGARSLAGMAPRVGRYRRPLLGLDRSTLRTAVEAEGLPVWDDPHNRHAAFARARVRHDLLPALEGALGPGVAAALARTADLLRADADALEEWAGDAVERAREAPARWRVEVLAALPIAVRRRVLRHAALEAGSAATDLGAAHVAELDALIVDWHGQAFIELPGHVRAVRRGPVISFGPPADE